MICLFQEGMFRFQPSVFGSAYPFRIVLYITFADSNLCGSSGIKKFHRPPRVWEIRNLPRNIGNSWKGFQKGAIFWLSRCFLVHQVQTKKHKYSNNISAKKELQGRLTLHSYLN